MTKRDSVLGVMQRQFDRLLEKWPNSAYRLLADGAVLFCVPGVKLDAGKWNMESATIWFVASTAYPMVPPENFYVEGLRLKHGGMPELTTFEAPPEWHGPPIEKFFNRALKWNPNEDTLTTWVHTCQRWFHTRESAYNVAAESAP